MTEVQHQSGVPVVHLETPEPMDEVRLVGNKETYHDKVIATIVEAAIEREREALPLRIKTSGRKRAEFDRKAGDLRRLVRDMHYRIGELKMSAPDTIGETLIEFLDELQEGCYGQFIALSRGESKLVLMSILADFGIRLDMDEVKAVSTYDADPDFIAFTKQHKRSKTIDGLLAGAVTGIVTALLVLVVPPFLGFDLSIPQFEIEVVSPNAEVQP